MLFFTKHLQHAHTLGMAFPSLNLVIDHLAKPKIREGRMEDSVTGPQSCRQMSKYLRKIVRISDGS
jgi:predicted TIM-barrel fold metal-dependent hydrolase